MAIVAFRTFISTMLTYLVVAVIGFTIASLFVPKFFGLVIFSAFTIVLVKGIAIVVAACDGFITYQLNTQAMKRFDFTVVK